jgi:hypothetical protein
VQEKTIALPTEAQALKSLRIKVETKKEEIDRSIRDVKRHTFLRLLSFLAFSNPEIFLTLLK